MDFIQEAKMNINLVIQGTIEILLAVLSGILIYFSSLKAFAFFTKGIDEEKEFKGNNIAASILISAFLFGIMLLIQRINQPFNGKFKLCFKRR